MYGRQRVLETGQSNSGRHGYFIQIPGPLRCGYGNLLDCSGCSSVEVVDGSPIGIWGEMRFDVCGASHGVLIIRVIP